MIYVCYDCPAYHKTTRGRHAGNMGCKFGLPYHKTKCALKNDILADKIPDYYKHHKKATAVLCGNKTMVFELVEDKEKKKV